MNLNQYYSTWAPQFCQPLTLIDRTTNERFGSRRSRFDITFKRNWASVQNDFRSLILAYLIEHIYVKNPEVNSGFSLRVFPWSSTSGLMSYTARRQETIEYNELSLRCLPGHLLAKKLMSYFWRICCIYYLLTDVQIQILHSLGLSHWDWVFRPLYIVRAGIPEGCWKLHGRAILT